MNTNWARVAYAGIFLVALPAVFAAWSQIGGQGHLDIIPWYWKLTLGCGLCLSFAGLSASISNNAHVVNRRSVAWFALVLAFVCAIFAVTVQAHLNESVEEPETEEGTTARRMHDFPAQAEETRRIIR